jgi:pimeloyl-ACP methyl ester carboxylesterase
MDNTTATALQKAYQLIKAGKQQEARAILFPIVRENQNIAEAWYLLGFAVGDSEKRLYAFQQVVRIDPSNQPAQKQIAKLLVAQRDIPQGQRDDIPVDAGKSISPFTVMPDLEPSSTPQPVPEPVLPVSAKQLPKKKRRSPLGLVLAGIAVLSVCFAGIGAWVVASNGGLAAVGLPFLSPPTTVFVPLPTPIPTVVLSPSPTPVYTAVFRGKVCPFDVPLGTRVRCGVVSVPQDREKNFTDLIELPLVIYQSPKPSADLVIFLQGGPGVESIDTSLALFEDYVTPILQDHDMVFFDPRGTGRSEPALDCPELNLAFMDSYFQNRSQDEAFKDFTASWSKCHDRFVADGIDPAAFNTTQSAADVRDIVMALGYQNANLLGISYGTRLGLTVMRNYPEIVRSAVLDSVVPMEAKMFNRRGADVQYALNKVFSDCAGSPRCNSAYPDLGNVFNTLVGRFDQEPVTIKAYDPFSGFVIDVKTNGVDMLAAIVWGLHQSELVPVVPKAIYDIQNGDYTFLSFALGVPGGEYNTIGMGTYFATVCPEQVYASTPEEMDADLSISPLIKKFSLAGLFGSSQNVFELCRAWGARAHDPRDDLPVKADIPALIISGQYDPTTPVTTGEMLANHLPENHFYIIPGMGHGATVGNDCSLSIMMDFLREPTKAPDSSCLQSQTFDFFIPYDGRKPIEVVALNDLSLHLKGVVPAGWKKAILQPTYSRAAYLFDPTLVNVQSFPAAKDTLLSLLSNSFENSGFEETPKKTGTRSANGLSWTIYQSKFNGEPVTAALAQVSSRRTLALIMVVSAPEQEAFYNGLFIPMLDALEYVP